MAAIDQLNLVYNSGFSAGGTGLAGNKIDRDRIVSIGLLEKGHIFTDTITKSYIQGLQQSGKLVYLKGVTEFVDKTPDHNYRTATGSGLKSISGKNPYEYDVTFENGAAFSKALNSLEGNGNFDLIFWDKNDVIWLTQNKAGDIQGFTLGMHAVGNYKGDDGTNGATNMMMLQLKDRNEIDLRQGWIKPDDFSAEDLDGVNDLAFTLSPVVAAATTLTVKALLNDKVSFVSGLTIAKLKVTKNGATITPSAIVANSSAKTYVLTITAASASDVFTFETYDTTAVSEIISIAGVLYNSNKATATVA
jgi:hypothetical protein